MRKLSTHMSVYGIGGILTKTINYLLVPLYTRVLLPANYGSLELIYNVGSIIAILYGFMIGSGYVRNYYSYEDEKDRASLLGSAIWFTVMNAIIFIFLTFQFADSIAELIFKFPNGGLFLKLVSISTGIYAVNTIFYNSLMVKEKPKHYVSINVTSLLITISLTIYFLVYLKLSVEGILYAQIIGKTIEFFILAVFALRKTIFKLSPNFVGMMLKYSIPLIPVQIAAFVLNLSDRFFLQHYSTLEQVGLYTLAYKISSIIQLFAIEPLRGFTPFIFTLVNNPDKCKKTLADFTRYYVFALILLILGIAMFSRELVLVMAQKAYSESWKSVFLISLSYGFYGLVVVSSYAIEIVKKNWISSAAWILGAVINTLLNFLLIPPFGVMGAALATALSYFIVLIGYWVVIKFVYPVPYRYFNFAGVMLAAISVYYLSTWINFGIVLSILIKAILFLAFLVCVVFSGYLTREELTQIMNKLPAPFLSLRQYVHNRFGL